MLIVVQKTSAVGCCTARRGGHVLQLTQVLYRPRHRAAVASSRDERWVLGQQVLRDCRPWGHIPTAQLEKPT
jgi:hypothetical protein